MARSCRRLLGLLLFPAAVATALPPVESGGAPGIREVEALYQEADYEGVIAATEPYLVAPRTRETADFLKLAGLAYYRKGRLHLASFDAARVMAARYYECCVARQDRFERSDFLQFSRGMLAALEGDFDGAATLLEEYRKKSKDRTATDIAAVWLGSVYKKRSKPGDEAARERLWSGMRWDNLRLASERSALGILLDVKTSERAPDAGSLAGDPVLARNAAVIYAAQGGLSRPERTRLLSAVKPADPLFSAPLKSGAREEYFDFLAMLAEARLSLDMARDLLTEYGTLVSTPEVARDVRVLVARCAFLLGDHDGLLKVAGREPDGARALVAWAHVRRGDVKAAEPLWQEAKTEDPALLGRVYAVLGLKREEADRLTESSYRSGGQEAYEHRAVVLKLHGQASRASDVLNEGYDYTLQNRFKKGATGNEPDYVVRFAASVHEAEMTDMHFANALLYFVALKYPQLSPLHDLSTSIAVCRQLSH